jgi:Core-2/I-Branching enzyme
MRPPIGFVLTTYNTPEHILYLCERLNAMFDRPPIAIHHDFSQCSLNASLFPGNVRFVEKWVPTRWGSISVTDGLLAALRLLYAESDPDWFVTLSATDYPIQRADYILGELFQSGFDGYLDSRQLKDVGIWIKDEGLGELSFRHPKWVQLGYNRYVAIPLLSPKMARWLHVAVETYCLRSPFLVKRLTPFGGSVVCHGGDAWLTGNRRVAEILLERTDLWEKLYLHYGTRIIPEESFFHTLFANTPGVNLCTDNKRYTDWRGCYAHPRTLGREDFPRLLESKHHFARKFRFDREMFASLDRAVDGKY